jgi:outer membrane lipoprotein-sorting protein
MTRTLISNFALLLFVQLWTLQPTYAQGTKDPMAEQILNAVSKKHKKLKGFKAVYEHRLQENTGQEKNTQKATITVRNTQYHLVLNGGQQQVFCDGKTVWSYLKKENEVTISEYLPDADEISPDKVYTFYQKGYKYVMIGEVKDGGEILQTIDLEPEDLNKEIAKIRMFIRKSDQTIKKWIIFERGTNNRQVFEVKSFEPNPPLDDALFVFDKSKYPGVKVVDLR